MAPAATRPHVAALTAALASAGLTVLPGGQGEPAPPCVVLWPTPGEPDGSALALLDDLLIVAGTLVACGTTTDQALWVADRIAATLNRTVLAVTGRSVDPLTLRMTRSVQRDDSLATPLQSASIDYRTVSRPA